MFLVPPCPHPQLSPVFKPLPSFQCSFPSCFPLPSSPSPTCISGSKLWLVPAGAGAGAGGGKWITMVKLSAGDCELSYRVLCVVLCIMYCIVCCGSFGALLWFDSATCSITGQTRGVTTLGGADSWRCHRYFAKKVCNGFDQPHPLWKFPHLFF